MRVRELVPRTGRQFGGLPVRFGRDGRGGFVRFELSGGGEFEQRGRFRRQRDAEIQRAVENRMVAAVRTRLFLLLVSRQQL